MKKTLLVVDDEPAICLVLAHYFASGFEVVPKTNGLEAMEWLAHGNRPVAIVVDYNMPLMNGPDFVRNLRANTMHQHTALIMLSGKNTSSHKIQCLRLGADDYLVKPFNPEELSLRIQNLLTRLRI